ncbi:unnamed protein product [Strongylus vulgaris]|uniref:methylated diphthine methylhydrolase n=1 Tax=Strongylus vulgaris TaxID=40348 RepID=A0A3P7ITV1_STRVU|nr:unnamed protein product [Strongylus vulgaris]
MSPTLDILQCIKAPAGVFRFEFLKSDVVIAAVTDGSLFITTFEASPSTESIPVSGDMLLDVSSSSRTDVACTDKAGNAHIVDINTGTVVATWKAHSLPYTNEGCEVWTCSLNDTLLCTGAEDATLKVWDTRTKTLVQRLTDFDAGITYSSWQEEHGSLVCKYILCQLSLLSEGLIILTGSYDQHIRLFDTRQTKEPLKTKETAGGVWHIEDHMRTGKRYHMAACMYGGWTFLDDNFDAITSNEKAGQELLYGVTMPSESLLVYTTFNDYKVTAVNI